MEKKQKKIICLVTLIMLFALTKTSLANSVEEVDVKPVQEIVVKKDDPIMPFETTSRKKTNYFLNAMNSITQKLKANLPTSYKTEGLTVKHQGTTYECWAFSFTSAFEAKDIKIGAEKKIYSPRHMDFSCSKSFKDITDFSNCFDRETIEPDGTAGGNYFLSTAYSASGKGPVLESAMPFQDDVSTKINYSDLNIKNEKQLDKTIMFDAINKKHENGRVSYYVDAGCTVPYTQAEVDNIRNKIKEQIRDNGSVCATLYEAGTDIDICLKSRAESPTGTANHGVLIVGWDDDYQAANWTTKGAYVVLNSYGKENFDNGYIYVSYDDVFIELSLMGLAESSEVDFEKVYEHDPFGATNTIISQQLTDGSTTATFDNSEISAVNIFTRDASKNEVLTEVGVSIFSYEKVEVYFTDEFQLSNDLYLPMNFKKVADLTDTMEPGFFTVPLKENVVLTKDRFAVCVRYVQDNEENIATVGIESRVLGTKWWNNVSGAVGETYFIDVLNSEGANKFWILNDKTASGEVYYKNASIKAYTREETTQSNVTITSNKYTINNQNKTIIKVPLATELDTFKTKIIANQEYKILDKNNNEVTNGEMKTGYKIKFESDEYEVSVIADISGDGKVDVLDLSRMRAHLVGRKGYILEGIYFNSADISGNGIVDIIDLARMRKECLK